MNRFGIYKKTMMDIIKLKKNYPQNWIGIMKFVFRQYFFDFPIELLLKLGIPGSPPFLHKMRGIEMGKNVFIATNVRFDFVYPEYIKIGNNVQIANGAAIYTHFLPVFDEIIENWNGNRIFHVFLDDYCQIGINALVIPSKGDIVLGKHSFITAGAVVTRSVPDYHMAVGNPARIMPHPDYANKKK